jgi:hypothetical protein
MDIGWCAQKSAMATQVVADFIHARRTTGGVREISLP